MLFRLLLFALGWLVILAVPGAGLGYLGYLALKPKLERRKLLRAARQRALLSPAREDCAVCTEPVDVHTDAYAEKIGWHHVNCIRNLLK